MMSNVFSFFSALQAFWCLQKEKQWIYLQLNICDMLILYRKSVVLTNTIKLIIKLSICFLIQQNVSFLCLQIKSIFIFWFLSFLQNWFCLQTSVAWFYIDSMFIALVAAQKIILNKALATDVTFKSFTSMTSNVNYG